jgi:hypothetical protein
MNENTNTTNVAAVENAQNVDQQAAAQQPQTPDSGDKKGFFTKAKEVGKKVWNSKPMKVAKVATLVAGGFAAGMLTANSVGKKSDESSEEASAAPSEATEDVTE